MVYPPLFAQTNSRPRQTEHVAVIAQRAMDSETTESKRLALRGVGRCAPTSVSHGRVWRSPLTLEWSTIIRLILSCLELSVVLCGTFVCLKACLDTLGADALI